MLAERLVMLAEVLIQTYPENRLSNVLWNVFHEAMGRKSRTGVEAHISTFN